MIYLIKRIKLKAKRRCCWCFKESRVYLNNCNQWKAKKGEARNCLRSVYLGVLASEKVTQMSAGSGCPAVTPGTGLVSKRTQLTGRRYQWADLSAAHASRYFSNCVVFFFFLSSFLHLATIYSRCVRSCWGMNGGPRRSSFCLSIYLSIYLWGWTQGFAFNLSVNGKCYWL